MMKFLVGSCEQRPMLRDDTVLRSSAVTIGTTRGLPVVEVGTGFFLILFLGCLKYVTVHHKPPVKSAFFILRYMAKYMGKLYSDEIEILMDLKCSYLS